MHVLDWNVHAEHLKLVPMVNASQQESAIGSGGHSGNASVK